MNALVWKRRWYVARPWILDSMAGLTLIAFMVGCFKLMSVAAFLCRAWEYCA